MGVRRSAGWVVCAAVCLFSAGPIFGHCEIPCGIYDDDMRVALVREHIGTVEKSMKQIVELGKKKPINYNQLVRWIDNKEAHANKIQEIVYQYFMTQRIKPTGTDEKEARAKYVRELSALHELLVYAMKAKQTTDQDTIAKMRKALDAFSESYFGKKEKK